MILKIFIPFLVICFLSESKAQELSTKLISQRPISAEKFIGVDEYGNTYLQTKNVFYKLEKDKKYQFTDFQLGMKSVKINTTTIRVKNGGNPKMIYIYNHSC